MMTITKLDLKYRQQMIDQVCEFVRIPSRSSPAGGEEGAIQSLIAEKMQDMGARVRCFEATDIPEFFHHRLCHGPDRNYQDRPTVIGEIGPESGKTLLLLAHSDTVPVNQPDEWSVDPFSGAVQDGKVFGLGVSDDKWGLSVMLVVMQALIASGRQIDKRLVFASTIDEEHGVGNGLLLLILAGVQADAAIYLDGTEMDICVGNLGGSNLYLRPHSALPPTLVKEHFEKLRVACEQASQSRSAMFQAFSLYKNNQMRGKSLIPQHFTDQLGDCLMIAFYTLPGEGKTATCEFVEGIATQALGPDFNLYSRSYREPWFEPSSISPSLSTVRIMEDSIRRIGGKPARINTISKQDVFILNNHAKIPALSFGISSTEGRGAHHQPDECVEIDELWKACQIVYHAVCQWLDSKP
jgi:acetylornithine deacetylase/succinyl-diaminopimelate desuccinylase-like protein